MDSVKIIVLVLVSFLSFACTGTMRYGSARDARMAELQEENRELKANMAVRMNMEAMDTINVQAPEFTLATVFAPHPGCEEGPYRVDIPNRQGGYLRMYVDDEQVPVFANGGEIGLVPPNETAHLCFLSEGRHVVIVEVFRDRLGQTLSSEKLRMEINVRRHTAGTSYGRYATNYFNRI